MLWIGPGKWELADRPNGYPMTVVRVGQRMDHDQQYIQGRVLHDNGDPTTMLWFLLLPLDQPRAVFYSDLRVYMPPWVLKPAAVGRAPVVQQYADGYSRVPTRDDSPPVDPDYRAAAMAFLHRSPPRSAQTWQHPPHHART